MTRSAPTQQEWTRLRAGLFTLPPDRRLYTADPITTPAAPAPLQEEPLSLAAVLGAAAAILALVALTVWTVLLACQGAS